MLREEVKQTLSISIGSHENDFLFILLQIFARELCCRRDTRKFTHLILFKTNKQEISVRWFNTLFVLGNIRSNSLYCIRIRFV